MNIYIFRVLKYFDNGTDKLLVDPTLKWKKLKAEKYNIHVPINNTPISLNDVPYILKNELGEIRQMDRWSKSLFGMPEFTSEYINQYYQKVNQTLCKKSTIVKKHFERGNSF